jgi:membrane protease YdiL (CAAX protease family)
VTEARVEIKAGLELPFRWWDGFVVLALFLLAGLLSLLFELDVFVGQLAAVALITAYLAVRDRLDEKTVFGDRPTSRQVAAGALLGVLSVVLVALVVVVGRGLTGWHDPVYPDWVVFRSLVEVPLPALVGTVVVAPLLEEIMFRSILYRGLLASLALPLAAALSAVIFSGAHYLEDGGLARAVATFLISIAIIWLYHRTRSLWPGMALHATFNALIVLFGYVAGRIVRWGSVLA